jgi:hypothetical protein
MISASSTSRRMGTPLLSADPSQGAHSLGKRSQSSLLRILTHLLNEISRIRRQFGASHEHIQQCVEKRAFRLETLHSHADRRLLAIEGQTCINEQKIDALDRRLQAIQGQLAYGFRMDFCSDSEQDEP